jgi:hypothetical protein
MSVRTILQLGDSRFREVALPVEDASNAEIAALVKDLADTLAHWRSTTATDAVSPRRNSAYANASSSCNCRATVAAGESGDYRA